jgi:hypothetical protein
VTDWATIAKGKSQELLGQFRAARADTAAKLISDLQAAGYGIQLAGDQIKVQLAPAGACLSDEFRKRIKEFKPQLLVLLAPALPVTLPIDYEQEYRIEMDMVRRRIAAAWTDRARRALKTILDLFPPVTKGAWLEYADYIANTESELRGLGELPPVLFAASSSPAALSA